MAKKTDEGQRGDRRGGHTGRLPLFSSAIPSHPRMKYRNICQARMPEVDGCFLQAESRRWRLSTWCTERPDPERKGNDILVHPRGSALKQEGISYIAGAELPCLIVNMVRGGPGLGAPYSPRSRTTSRPQSGGGHGDYRTVVTLAPSTNPGGGGAWSQEAL